MEAVGGGDAGNPIVASEVEIRFKCGAGAQYELSDDLLHAGCFFPTNLSRRGLSEALNHLLDLTDDDVKQVFDFLVELPNGKQEFLRTSLQEYMQKRGLTAESSITLIYCIARTSFEPQTVAQGEDWFLSMSTGVSSQGAGLIAAGCTNGSLVVLPWPVSETAGNGINSGESTVVTTAGRTPYTIQLEDTLDSIAGVHFLANKDGEAETGRLLAASYTGSIYLCDCSIERASDSENRTQPISRIDISVSAEGRSDFGGFDSVTASEDGRMFYAGTSNGKMFSYAYVRDNSASDIAPGKKRLRTEDKKAGFLKNCGAFEGHTAAVTSMDMPSVETQPFLLASGSLDGTVRVWDTLTRKQLCSLPCLRAVTGLSFSSQAGTEFATSHDDGRLRIWDVRSSSSTPTAELFSDYSVSERQHTFIASSRYASGVAWHPADGNLIATGGHDGAVKLFDLRSPNVALLSRTIQDAKILCFCWAPLSIGKDALNSPSHRLLVGASDCHIHAFEI